MNLYLNTDASPSDALRQGVTTPLASVSLPELYVGDKNTVNLYFINNSKTYTNVSGSSFKISVANKTKIPTGGSYVLTLDNVSASFSYSASALDLKEVFPSYEIHGKDCSFSISGSSYISVYTADLQPECIGVIQNNSIVQTRQKPYSYVTASANIVSASVLVGVQFQLDLATKELIQALPQGEKTCQIEIKQNDNVILQKDVTIKNQLIGDYFSDFTGVQLPHYTSEEYILNKVKNMTWSGGFN